jgi:hypothetical protein
VDVVTVDNNKFIVRNVTNTSKHLMFDVSGVSDNTTRTLEIPDKNGIIATLGDIAATGNEFNDGDFTIQNTANNTRKLQFDASNISNNTTRTLTIPNDSGILALESNVAPLLQGFSAYTNSQTIPNASITDVIFDIKSGFGSNDPNSLYNTSTGIFTAPVDGYYNFHAFLSYNQNTTGLREVTIISVDPSILLAIGRESNPGGTANSDVIECSVMHVELAQGTEVKVRTQQSSGDPLDIGFSRFGGHLVGFNL